MFLTVQVNRLLVVILVSPLCHLSYSHRLGGSRLVLVRYNVALYLPGCFYFTFCFPCMKVGVSFSPSKMWIRPWIVRLTRCSSSVHLSFSYTSLPLFNKVTGHLYSSTNRAGRLGAGSIFMLLALWTWKRQHPCTLTRHHPKSQRHSKAENCPCILIPSFIVLRFHRD
jgi:hypothetical protein